MLIIKTMYTLIKKLIQFNKWGKKRVLLLLLIYSAFTNVNCVPYDVRNVLSETSKKKKIFLL